MKGRKALQLAPTYNTIERGRDAYLDGLRLRELVGDSRGYGRYWSFHSIPTTVALPDNRFAKSLKPFTSHTTEATFRELLREYTDLGCPRPSGYADIFHERFRSPRVQWSVNALLAPVFAGGWQEAINPGRHTGVFYKYDMRSAYLWAATLGLPDTATYTRSTAPWKGKYDGVYRIELMAPEPTAPFPFNRARECLATNAEIDTYGLRIARVVDGCVWKRTVDGAPIVDAIMQTSTWKQAGRMYWGRWAQMQKVECFARGKKWKLPNLALNIPWAHMIVARVRMRLWEAATDAVHVFVDSVITPHRLPTGDKLGDWKLERTYERGVIVKGTGQYGEPDALKWERAAGVPQNSPLRYMSGGVA